MMYFPLIQIKLNVRVGKKIYEFLDIEQEDNQINALKIRILDSKTETELQRISNVSFKVEIVVYSVTRN